MIFDNVIIGEPNLQHKRFPINTKNTVFFGNGQTYLNCFTGCPPRHLWPGASIYAPLQPGALHRLPFGFKIVKKLATYTEVYPGIKTPLRHPGNTPMGD